MKKWILLCALTAALAFAAVLAWRLSADALALIAGVMLGLLALIPTLALALLMLRRSTAAEGARQAPPPQSPVIVVSGGYPAMMPAQGAHPHTQGMIPAPPPQQQRQFRMMGYESTDTVDLNDGEWTTFS